MMNSNQSMAQLSAWTESQSKNKNTTKPPIQSKPEPTQQPVQTDDDFTFGRDMRSNSSMERFETWTDSMQKNNPSGKNQQQAKGKGDEDDYGGDEFEDYDEDFEPDEEAAPAPVAPAKVHKAPDEAPAPAKATAKVIQSSAPVPAAVAPQQSAERADAKATSRPATNKVVPKKFESNMQMSFSSLRMTDPRGLRIQRLLNSKVMELQVDKHTILNQLPITPYELYMRNLRLTTANVRQIGVPVDLEKRDIDINTDAIETADQSVQFSYGDDTAFYRTMDDIKGRRNMGTSDRNGERSASTGTSTSTGTGTGTQTVHARTSTADAGSAIAATRLTTFLQHASRICEHILADQEESKSSVEDRQQRSDHKHSLFDSKDWVSMGTDKTNGANEIVRTRRIACTKFSALQPHLLMTAHPYPTDDTAELDLKPYKGLYCVWDAGNSGGPQYVLESTGQPTVCAFSATQAHFVVGGTLEGSLHLWDLREDSSIHKDRDALDLKISKGIRKPTYSTNLAYLPMTATGTSAELGSGTEEDSWQHSAPVVQIESLISLAGSQASQVSQSSLGCVISQFVSIDEAGMVIFWVTQQNVVFGFGEDLQRAPWGGVALVQTRQIHTHSHGLSHFRPSNKAGSGGGGAALQGTVSMACIPSDLSTLLVAGSEGEVNKVSRFGDCTAPLHYRRARTAASDTTLTARPDSGNSSGATSSGINSRGNSDKNKGKYQEMRLFSAVSCLSVYSPSTGPAAKCATAEDSAQDSKSGEDMPSKGGKNVLNKAPLVLVGRHDGTLDLFHLDCETPLQSWDLSTFITDSGRTKGAKASRGSAVVLLQWATRPGAFFAADRSGDLYHFDLHVQAHAPVSVEAVGVTDKILSRCIDISRSRAVTGTFFVSAVTSTTARDGSAGDILKVRRGNSSLHKDINAHAEDGLYSKLCALSAVKFAAPTVQFVPPGADDISAREGKK